MNFKICLVLSLFICISIAGYIPKHYWQLDQRWRDTLIGFGSKTIGNEGSLIVSLASAAGGFGIFSDKDLFDPLIMNEWLKKHGGFVQEDQVVWDSLTPLGLEFVGFTTDIKKMVISIVRGDALILKIKEENRYVVGYLAGPDGFVCKDPAVYAYGGVKYYSFDNIDSGFVYTVIKL